MKTNKQFITRIHKTVLSLIAIGTILIPTLAIAKTAVNLESASATVRVGQQLSVSIMVAPVDESAFTSKIALSYPSNLLDVSSFSFAPSWLPLAMPGYDVIDATAGSIIKTAGYPNGIASGQSSFLGPSYLQLSMMVMRS